MPFCLFLLSSIVFCYETEFSLIDASVPSESFTLSTNESFVMIFLPGNCTSTNWIFESLLVTTHIILPNFQLLLGKLSSFTITT